jgi:hypothetical protein
VVGLWGGCVRKIFDTQHLYLLSELVPVDPWQLGYSHHTLESGELGKKHSRAVVSHLTPSPLASEKHRREGRLLWSGEKARSEIGKGDSKSVLRVRKA